MDSRLPSTNEDTDRFDRERRDRDVRGQHHEAPDSDKDLPRQVLRVDRDRDEDQSGTFDQQNQLPIGCKRGFGRSTSQPRSRSQTQLNFRGAILILHL